MDLVNTLEQEKAQGKAGRIALSLLCAWILDPRRAWLPAVQPVLNRRQHPRLPALRKYAEELPVTLQCVHWR